MNTEESVPFSQILDELLDESIIFQPSRLFYLSQLNAADAKKLSENWNRISLERRRNLTRDLETFAEGDSLLFFDAVGMIALKDEDPEVRVAGIRLNALEEDPAFAETLVGILESDPHFEVRAGAALALGRYVYLGELEDIPAQTYRLVEEALMKAHKTDEQTIVRRRTLEAIGASSREQVNHFIEDAFAKDDEDWQASALFAMGASANSKWESIVIRMLESDSSLLRHEAARAAGKLDLKQAKPDLFAIAQNDVESEVRMAAVWALTDIGGKDVSDFVENLMESADSDAEVDFLEEAYENLQETLMFSDLELPLFDFDEGTLKEDDFDPDFEGDI